MMNDTTNLLDAEHAHAAAVEKVKVTADKLDAATATAAATEEKWSEDESDANWQAVEAARRERDQLRLRLRRVEAAEVEARAGVEAAQREADAAELARLTLEAGHDALAREQERLVSRAAALFAELVQLDADLGEVAGRGFQARERVTALCRALGAPHPDLPHWSRGALAIAIRKSLAAHGDAASGGDDRTALLTPLSMLDMRWSDAERGEALRAARATAEGGE